MNSVNLLKVHYFSYTEAQIWARIYPSPLFLFPLLSSVPSLKPTEAGSQISCAVLQEEAMLNKLLCTSLLHWGQTTWFFIKWLCFIYFFAKDNTRLTYEIIYEQNTKFEIPLCDWYIFIHNKNHVTEHCVFRSRKSTWENMWLSPFALQQQTGPDTRRQWLSFDMTLTWRNFIICRECNITA
jgi:hypothetical protein